MKECDVWSECFLNYTTPSLDVSTTQSKNGKVDTVEYGAPITIGDNCWLASNITVCPGVTIGNGCVIGAGAWVTKDVPDNSLVVGVPGRVVRKITEKDRLNNYPY